MKTVIFVVLCVFVVVGCQNDQAVKMNRSSFGTLTDGSPVTLYTMTNANMAELQVMDYGATIVSIKVPDKNGTISEVTLGFDSLAGYLDRSPFFGSVVGRYGNRIGDAQFTLDGVDYSLTVNNNGNHLHGGKKGFDKQLWQAKVLSDSSVQFSYTSPDGEEGYPGTLQATVTYTLTGDNAVRLDYEAATDKPTIVNLTNHTYFNLRDAGETNILDHELMIDADHYVPVDDELIPTGEMVSVEGTPFDFRKATPIGARIDADHPQIENGGGYDHNFVLNHETGSLDELIKVYEPATGRTMTVATTEPGVQFYTGNFLSGLKGRSGTVYNKRAAFCLETQHYPDSPNNPQFPSVVLRPGETYQSTTIYDFGVESM